MSTLINKEENHFRRTRIERFGEHLFLSFDALIREYANDKDVTYFKKGLANKLKHHVNLQPKGIAVGKSGFYSEKDYESRNTTYSSEWTESLIIDIDKVNELIKGVHNLLVTHTKTVIEFIVFRAYRLTGGKAIVAERSCWITKKKHEYRRILC